MTAKGNVAKIVRLLNSQIKGQSAKGATFRVAPGKLNAKDEQPESFTITFGTAAQALARVQVQRTAQERDQQWSGYPLLHVASKGEALDIMWHTGGSGCCPCSYLIALRGSEFRASWVDAPHGGPPK